MLREERKRADVFKMINVCQISSFISSIVNARLVVHPCIAAAFFIHTDVEHVRLMVVAMLVLSKKVLLMEL